MSNDEIEKITKILRRKKPRKVLEYGSGFSTVYWPEMFDFIETWHSVEPDKRWYDRITEELKKRKIHNATVIWCPNKKKYPTSPPLTDYDFILIDGDFRNKCMEVASKYLEEDGFVMLHDSGRKTYRQSFQNFDNYEEILEGEEPDPENPGYYKHRGITVFWNGTRRNF